ncbi:hypothetical protein HHI36_004795 [Cryptolaemus montrouzieri]|uniref:Protein-S-isoprenylcysteine O-methyltransferase n=1 Tax=Cryptolaemus montrouzieri TaxID=559131 RepID=A0ABD2NSN1_9CUCU
MISREANVALNSFFAAFGVFSSVSVLKIISDDLTLSVINCLSILIINSTLLFILINFIYKGYEFEIAIRSSFLGALFGTGIFIELSAPSHLKIFGIYMCIMSIFHYTEFFTLAIIDPKLVSPNSFVINHSPEYTFAAVFSWIEFFVEAYFYPSLKQYSIISYFGCAICIGGELLRKTAMFNAGSNFNHLVQYEKAKDHVLVTSGVYSWFRHPSYVGWFYWSIGTQITLLNPICIVGYTIASWTFFRQRIFIEESTLLNFFGQQYCDYQNRVGTGIPFVNGYLI